MDPSAVPWIATTTGSTLASITSTTSGSQGETGGVPNPVMSAPAENRVPARMWMVISIIACLVFRRGVATPGGRRGACSQPAPDRGAAVDHDRLAGHVGAGARREEHRGARDLVRLADATERGHAVQRRLGLGILP